MNRIVYNSLTGEHLHQLNEIGLKSISKELFVPMYHELGAPYSKKFNI